MTHIRLQAQESQIQSGTGARAYQCGKSFEVAPLWDKSPRELAIRTGLRIVSCSFPTAWPGLARDPKTQRMSLYRLPPEVRFVTPGSLAGYVSPPNELGGYHYFLAHLVTMFDEWRASECRDVHPLAAGPIIDASTMRGSHRQVFGCLIARQARTGAEITKFNMSEYLPPNTRFHVAHQ